MTKEELAEVVSQMIWDHKVLRVIDYSWGSEEADYCRSCAYLGDKEDPALHTANIVLEYLEDYYKERFSDEVV